MKDMDKFSGILERAERLLDRLDRWMPQAPADVDWEAAVAFRWRRSGGGGYLQPVSHPHHILLRDLRGISQQKQLADRNTRQFVEGRAANNVLFTGARGTGKSSLVKALLNRYAPKGLRLVEVSKQELGDLPDIVERFHGRPEKFILFCDDLSFEEGEAGYTALKAALDGSVASVPDNVLIYATSNRRHLMPEYMSENLETRHAGGEIHPGETTEEKVSLSERFGLWLSFYPFSQDEYLDIAGYWLGRLGAKDGNSEEIRRAALQWALARGSRSGRTAWQFARDWSGRKSKRST